MKSQHPNKSAPSAPTEAEAPTTPEAAAEAVDDTGAVLSGPEQDQLLYSTKFLLNVMHPRFDRARVAAGFTARDHGEGWMLFRRASGEDLALAAVSALSAARSGAEPALPVDALQHLDSFENKWFPRTRRVIERFAAPDERQPMLDAFFHNLSQQPLGPGLMQSVPTFVQRVRALGAGTFGSGAKVRQVLAERGLTDAVLDAMQRAVDALRAAGVVAEDADEAAKAAQSAAEAQAAAEARRAQREGFEAFRAYWLDWSQTFREELPRREAIVLGVSSPRAKKAKST